MSPGFVKGCIYTYYFHHSFILPGNAHFVLHSESQVPGLHLMIATTIRARKITETTIKKATSWFSMLSVVNNA